MQNIKEKLVYKKRGTTIEIWEYTDHWGYVKYVAFRGGNYLTEDTSFNELKAEIETINY